MNFEKTQELLKNPTGYEVGPGRACAVYYNGKVVYKSTSGIGDLDKNTPMQEKDLYRLFSCTKPLTSFAAMTLVDKGLLDLDEPLSKYIPEFKDMKLENGQKAQNEIKIKHLFTMSAGLTYVVDDATVEEVRQRTEGRCPTVETVKALASRPLAFEPGTEFEYSLCLDVLAAVVELCSGMKFSDYVKKTVLDPLCMTETYFKLPKDQKSRLATIYKYENGNIIKPQKENIYDLGSEYESGGAGIISSLNDYIKFLAMLCRKGKTEEGISLVKPETIDIMRTPIFGEEWQQIFIDRTNWSSGYNGYNYALGVYVLDNPHVAGSRAAKGTFGWDGAAGSYISVDPENNIAIFYLQHMLHYNTMPYHNALRNAIYEDILG